MSVEIKLARGHELTEPAYAKVLWNKAKYFYSIVNVLPACSIDVIRDRTKLSRITVMKALRDLKKLGLVEQVICECGSPVYVFNRARKLNSQAAFMTFVLSNFDYKCRVHERGKKSKIVERKVSVAVVEMPL
jgi:DNA-binding transcriptional ArsR family regulator